MDIEPIEITIDDLRTFAQVASLVDKPEFIEKSSQLRKKYQIKQPINASIESICKHFVKLASDKEVKATSIPKPNSKGFLHLFSYPDRLLDYLIEHNDYPDDKKVDESIKTIQKQFIYRK